jgi:hypothetical protein
MSTRRSVLKQLGVGALVTTGIAVAGSSTAQAATDGDEILLDSYTGTDDQKLTAALAAAQSSNPRRPIRLAARSHTFSLTRTTFSGLRILGPNVGWQNPEIANTAGALPQCNVTLNCGSGASSWLVGTATTYDVMVAGICFKSSNGATQFYHHPYSAGTSYATRLHELSFYGFKHVVGLPGDAFAMTLNTFSGTWTCVGVRGTQFSVRGSDNFLWKQGEINYGWWGENAGQYMVRFENLMKSSVANMYLTARDGARAVLVEGSSTNQGGLDISDCVIEGNNKDQASYGALVVVKGGGVSFTNTKLNFAMANPAKFTDQKDTGMIMVAGGVCLLSNTWVNRATTATETVPVVAVSGGQAHVSTLIGMGGNWVGKPKVVRTGGTLVTDTTVTAA